MGKLCSALVGFALGLGPVILLPWVSVFLKGGMIGWSPVIRYPFYGLFQSNSYKMVTSLFLLSFDYCIALACVLLGVVGWP